MKAVERTGINQASGGQFAFIPGGGLFPAALGDLLADVSNCYSGVRSGAPAAALMERSLLRWMAGLLGYPETAGGDLTSGASIANLEGIVTARDAIGISSADVPRSVVYLTSQTHHCVDKALRISGLVGRRPPRGAGRPLADARRRARGGRAGRHRSRPASLARGRHGRDDGHRSGRPPRGHRRRRRRPRPWLQVDAAYGGFFISTEHGKRALAGIERSRSATMDPHKGLFLPFGSGALLVRDDPARRGAPVQRRVPARLARGGRLPLPICPSS